MAQNTYGVAKPADLAGKSGLDILQAMLRGELPGAPIAKLLGFWLVEASEGQVVFEGEPSADYFNPMGTVHGGWALTIIDSATGCAALSVLPAGIGYTTLETKGNMTRAIMPEMGRVRCVGKVVSGGRRIITADSTITDARGRMLAHGTSTLLVMRPGE